MFIDATSDNCPVLVRDWQRPVPDVIAAFGQYPAANVGDGMDRFGLMSPTICAQWRGARCVGPAFTILTREGDNLAIHRGLDEVVPGDVLVINGLGADTRAVFGDLLAEICVQRGVAGVVIDGAVRDVEAIAEIGLPLWAKGITPAGPTKNGPGAVGGTIACGGLVVAPGDLVVADGDGVAVVPQARIPAVMQRLTEIRQNEEQLRIRIRDDSPTRD